MKTYLVGGAVRDLLMGNPIQDRDYVVVGASPQTMLAMGYEQVGADFPVFLHPVTRDEYALARTERKTGKGYHGFAVHYDEDVTLAEDLGRRDLTINSIALDEDSGQFIDPYDGVGDINKGILRHTSNAFRDDPLRVIRLARFQARFPHFLIDANTHEMAHQMVKKGELNELPYERFAAEIEKVLMTCSEVGIKSFFATLHGLEVGKYVDFFKSVNLTLLAKAGVEVKRNFDKKDRMVAFAALARGDQQFSAMVGGADGWLMNQIVSQNRGAAGEAELDGKTSALMWLLNRLGWQQRERVEFFGDIANCAINMDFDQAFNRRVLVNSWIAAAPLSSKLAPTLVAEGLKGAEIGLAIRAARIECLRDFVCDEPTKVSY